MDGRSVTTLVLFGKKGTQPLLGAYSLEGLGLSVDSRRRRLVPMPIVVVAVSRGSSGRSERPGSRARDGVALDSPGRGIRGALDYRIRMLPLRSVPPSVGAGGG